MSILDFFKSADINKDVKEFRADNNAVLLDVRSEEEYAAGHIPGSINIPLDRIRDAASLIPDKKTAVFVYCLRGARSRRAVTALSKMGYEAARSIGGINRYSGQTESGSARTAEIRLKEYLPAVEAGEQLQGFRYDATGVFGYSFYKGRDLLCNTSSMVVPDPDVVITGHKVHWVSKHPTGRVLPGLTRTVYDSDHHSKIGDICYLSPGKYEINGSIQVLAENDGYLFSCDNEPIAQIHRYTGEWEWKPESAEYEYTPYFQISLSTKLDKQLLFFILSFPMLRFDF